MTYIWNKELNIFLRESGEVFNYSDGAEVEKRLLDVVRNASDLSTFSTELSKEIKDWPSEYHFSRARHCLVRPLEIKSGEKVLELGCGCGAISRYLGEIGAEVVAVEGSIDRAKITAERCRDLSNVKVFVDDLLRFDTDERFDWILLIGVLEYAPMFSDDKEPAQHYLRTVSRFLKSDGKLVIAIENKLGLKYFNACGEDHVGIPFYGIQNLYGPKTPRTFGRAELREELLAAGFLSCYYYYPFPDYKLPSVVFSEDALKEKQFDAVDLIIRSHSRDYSGSPYRLFDEALVYSTLSANGLFAEFSNSFLVVASLAGNAPYKSDKLAMTFAINRIPEYSTITSFRRYNNTIKVIKEPVFPGLSRICQLHDGLCISNVPGESNYLPGHQLFWHLLRARNNNATLDQIVAELQPWLKYLLQFATIDSTIETSSMGENERQNLKNLVVPGIYLDCVPFNLLESSEGLIFIDKEWQAYGDIPLGWVITRGVMHSLTTGLTQGNQIMSVPDLVRELCRSVELSVSLAEIADWVDMEARFQSLVTGQAVSDLSISPNTTSGLVSLNQALVEFNQASVEKERQIAELNQASVEKERQIVELNQASVENERQIVELKATIMQDTLQIQQMQSGILMNLLRRYQKVVEKLLRTGTKRRYYYELGLSGMRIILNEGWRSFFKKARNWLNVRQGLTTNRSIIPPSVENSPKKLKKLLNSIAFPDPSGKLEVSIVIPVYNKWQYTANCLYSIFKNTPGCYEVIIVDDCSTDETKKIFSKIKNLRFIHNDKNLGFVDSCNYGAEVSTGDNILFLNNDTIVTQNWLQPLLDVIQKENVGAVGSKLIFPNGTLQEAGGIIWNDGSGCNYGRGDNPDKPEYNFLREVDYCTGACLLVKRELFERIGGFDVRFSPGYYEETDICFSIRKIGYKVVYQPKSSVIHFEGITNGTDISSGIKKYQEINKSKFYEKWKDILQKYHFNPSPNNLILASDKRKGKRILVIDVCVPNHDKDSGSLRMFNILKILIELGYKVTFIGDNLLRMEPYTQELQQHSIEVLYTPHVASIEKYVKDFGKYFQTVILSRPEVAIKYMDIVHETCKQSKIIYDTVDLAFLRESRRAAMENNTQLLKQAESLKQKELYLVKMSDVTFVVSDVEKEILLKENPSFKIEIISNIHQIRKPEKLFSQRKDILFVGGFYHSPNVDAVNFFVDQVFPLLKRKIPEVRFFIAGSNPPKQITELCSKDIIVTGYVKDLSPYFESCKLFVAPLRYGAGVKGKINQSMSYGLPVVTTTIGAEGMGLVEGVDVLIADDPEKIVEKIVTLYKNEELWKTLSQNSMENVKKYFSFDLIRTKLQNLI